MKENLQPVLHNKHPKWGRSNDRENCPQKVIFSKSFNFAKNELGYCQTVWESVKSAKVMDKDGIVQKSGFTWRFWVKNRSLRKPLFWNGFYGNILYNVCAEKWYFNGKCVENKSPRSLALMDIPFKLNKSFVHGGLNPPPHPPRRERVKLCMRELWALLSLVVWIVCFATQNEVAYKVGSLMFHFTQNIQVRQQWRWACSLWFCATHNMGLLATPYTNNTPTQCPQQTPQYLSTGIKHKNLKKNNLVEHIKLIMGGWVETTRFTHFDDHREWTETTCTLAYFRRHVSSAWQPVS